jgi:hypothetical protein
MIHYIHINQQGEYTMSNKQRQFKSYENTTRYWSGSSNKFSSSMKNIDIDYCIKTQNWDKLIELSKKGLQRSFYNREQRISEPASYDRYNNAKMSKKSMFNIKKSQSFKS